MTTPDELSDGHDRRCERANTQAHRLACRCAARAEVRALFTEAGAAHAMSNEALEVQDPGDLISDTVNRAMRALMHAIDEAGRVPVPTTVHVISDLDTWLDATSVRFAALTVPKGTPVTDSLLECADDWMRARGLRH